MADAVEKKAERRATPRLILINKAQESALMEPLFKAAGDRNWQLINLDLLWGQIPEDPKPAAALVFDWQPDEFFERLEALSIPYVSINHSYKMAAEHPGVVHDIYQAGVMGVQHFLERGFNQLAYVGFQPWGASVNAYRGFQSAADNAGVPVHLLQLKANHNNSQKMDLRLKELVNWLHDLPKPVGLMTYSDSSAAAIAYVCQLENIQVPEAVAILGNHNDESTCKSASVAISSIRYDLDETIHQAVILLEKLIQGEKVSDKPVMIPPVELVCRRSTDLLAVEDLRVAKALRYIWDHYNWSLSIKDVVRETQVNARTLTRAFKKSLGRTIQEEIFRKRIDVCCHLLKTTDKTVKEIAELSGFNYPSYLHRRFHENTGMTPADYRKKYQKVSE